MFVLLHWNFWDPWGPLSYHQMFRYPDFHCIFKKNLDYFDKTCNLQFICPSTFNVNLIPQGENCNYYKISCPVLTLGTPKAAATRISHGNPGKVLCLWARSGPVIVFAPFTIPTATPLWPCKPNHPPVLAIEAVL